jgi:hypothetical protein
MLVRVLLLQELEALLLGQAVQRQGLAALLLEQETLAVRRQILLQRQVLAERLQAVLVAARRLEALQVEPLEEPLAVRQVELLEEPPEALRVELLVEQPLAVRQQVEVQLGGLLEELLEEIQADVM